MTDTPSVPEAGEKMKPLSDEELAALEAAASEATPGPWESEQSWDRDHTDVVFARYQNGKPDYIATIGRSELLQQNQDSEYISLASPDAMRRLIAELRTLRRTPSPAASEKGWQPIETAPRNGRVVLITTAGIGTLVRVGFWDTQPDGDRWSIWPGRERMNPTHWMPLPSPPSSPSTAAKGE